MKPRRRRSQPMASSSAWTRKSRWCWRHFMSGGSLLPTLLPPAASYPPIKERCGASIAGTAGPITANLPIWRSSATRLRRTKCRGLPANHGGRQMKWLLGAVGLMAAPAAAQTTSLFASDDPIHIKIAGPVNAVARGAEDSTAPREATLSLAGTAETYPIRLSARGITRRLKLTCSFPPLRVDFAQKPPASSLFAGQGRLKLVTHCQNDTGFQQHLLLEYSAYRIFNLISPVSFR